MKVTLVYYLDNNNYELELPNKLDLRNLIIYNGDYFVLDEDGIYYQEEPIFVKDLEQ